MWHMEAKTFAGIVATIALAAVLGVFLILTSPKWGWAAGPSEKWGHDAETSQWFRNLHAPNGFPCCDYADGTRIEDPADYKENNDGSYEVFARERWVHVPKEKVVTIPNRVGYAILWWSPAAPEPYCFMPGTRV